jgi:hypothetical protein
MVLNAQVIYLQSLRFMARMTERRAFAFTMSPWVQQAQFWCANFGRLSDLVTTGARAH